MRHITPEIAFDTLALYKEHGSEPKAAAALGISRSTFHGRLQRAKQVLGSDITMSIMHEQRFAELSIANGVVLVCSDVHCWPGPLTTAQRAFVWFVERFKPTAVVINGDLFDGTSISRFPSSNWNTRPSIKEEVEACQRFTGLLERAAGNAKLLLVPGNHDERYNRRLIAEVPEYAGIAGFNHRSLV